ncbi:cytidine deaminase [Natranaerovirga hydrolytica]|uniref:Cytidine deaminase n=1 Tax=Natranaerovirga hydrolytica TaxID=680378 RepID=A0A4R1MYF4_9FIRM|nr:cytidine deaminase [Natranaerovirga hydrolytica]TCK98246.1 cytidine deaminase [Natranaerovirga hydrolytica]
MDNDKLIKEAKVAMEFSYSPYSKFKVGAALLTKSGKIYTGCNIENASYGATNCAERVALHKAISEGEKEFIKIAVVSSSNDLTYPCGICRQVLAEFMPKGQLILMNQQEQIKVFDMEKIMPFAFKLDEDTMK